MHPRKTGQPHICGSNDRAPQRVLDHFWDKFITKSPGKITSIFHPSLYASSLQSKKNTREAPECRSVSESYEAAAGECRAMVDRIVRQCQLTNEKFTDPDFDIERDFAIGRDNFLRGLLPYETSSVADERPRVSSRRLRDSLDVILTTGILDKDSSLVNFGALRDALDPVDPDAGNPGAVHRVSYIFKKPVFCLDGYSPLDVRQGNIGDCWFLSAVSTICSDRSLVDRVCVKRDENCGVYGFVFYRDGEWISTVVDDNLYMANHDFEGDPYDSNGEKELRYKESDQTGSDALFFARCADQNEMWLPLLEKAYAKVHGDYDALNAGAAGEAVEDLTGGVTTSIKLNKILDQQKLWQQLTQANGDYVFAVVSPPPETDVTGIEGLTPGHAYSILRATEEVGEDGHIVQLVLIRNPWGVRDSKGIGEWSGAWSDGSKQWTPYWMEKLNHNFGDDGQFWMSYDDMMRKFAYLDRTRLFNNDWKVIQQWTSVNVSWATASLDIEFLVELKKAGAVVLVLSQLDTTYFEGLEGQYSFELDFVLRKDDVEGDHIISVRCCSPRSGRSVSADLELEEGRYEVIPLIRVNRDLQKLPVEDVVRRSAKENPEKLRQIGLNYDAAHAKVHREENGADENCESLPRLEKSARPEYEDEGEQSEDEEGDWQTDEERDNISSLAGSHASERRSFEAHAPARNDNDDSRSTTRASPWNPVCVIGLRVFSKNDATLDLLRLQDKEGAARDVDKTIPAKATM